VLWQGTACAMQRIFAYTRPNSSSIIIIILHLLHKSRSERETTNE